MLERLQTLETEHAELEARLGDPDIAADNKRFVQLTRRYAELGDLVAVGRHLRERTEDLEVARALLAEADAAERDELRSRGVGRRGRHRPSRPGVPPPAAAEGSQRRTRRHRRDPWSGGWRRGEPVRS
ncbi:MAG: PCRF domain-containing protein [Acidimicrobiales bacterium]